MNNPPYILVDEFRLIVEAMRLSLAQLLTDNGLTTINYDFGYIETLNMRLQAMGSNQETNILKFPLIWVRQPFTIIRNAWGKYGTTQGLDIFIIAGSTIGYNESERMEKIFKPIINPIYREFLRQIGLSKTAFSAGPEDMRQHSETDFYYFGEVDNADRKKKAVFNDIIDTKRISDLTLLVNNNLNC